MKTLKYCLLAISLVRPKKLDFGYKHVENEWGSFHYKMYGEMQYLDAVEKCRADGGRLPVPLSGWF